MIYIGNFDRESRVLLLNSEYSDEALCLRTKIISTYTVQLDSRHYKRQSQYLLWLPLRPPINASYPMPAEPINVFRAENLVARTSNDFATAR